MEVASIERRLARLAGAEDWAREKVEYCRRMCELVDDDPDDDGSASDELNAAEDELRGIERLNAQVAAAYEAYQSEVRRFRAFASCEGMRAVSDLGTRIEHLQAYHARKIDFERADVGTSAPVIDSSEAKTASVPLPRGFQWVDLSDIEVARDLRDIQGREAFLKTDYETMSRGLQSLQSEILPRLASAGTVARDLFADLDRAADRTYEQGLQRVYEAFFGDQDYIYLERGRDAEKFSIVNGRHRIKVAQDLGWDQIPAQVKDLHPGDDHGD